MDFLAHALPLLLTLLDQHLPEILAVLGAAFAKSLHGLLKHHLAAKNAKLAEEALEILRRRLGEALANGVIASTGSNDSQVAYDAVAYVERTMADTLAKANIPAADLAERAVVEAKRHRRGLTGL